MRMPWAGACHPQHVFQSGFPCEPCLCLEALQVSCVWNPRVFADDARGHLPAKSRQSCPTLCDP